MEISLDGMLLNVVELGVLCIFVFALVLAMRKTEKAKD